MALRLAVEPVFYRLAPSLEMGRLSGRFERLLILGASLSWRG